MAKRASKASRMRNTSRQETKREATPTFVNQPSVILRIRLLGVGVFGESDVGNARRLAASVVDQRDGMDLADGLVKQFLRTLIQTTSYLYEEMRLASP
jgi:hypothetical protein